VAPPAITKLITPDVFLPPAGRKKSTTTKKKKSSATSSTSSTSKKKTGPLKKDLEMFNLTMKTFKHSNSDDEDDAENDSSSEELISHNHDPNLFGHDPFTSQDPIPGLDDFLFQDLF
jgi:hypothetical protein